MPPWQACGVGCRGGRALVRGDKGFLESDGACPSDGRDIFDETTGRPRLSHEMDNAGTKKKKMLLCQTTEDARSSGGDQPQQAQWPTSATPFSAGQVLHAPERALAPPTEEG